MRRAREMLIACIPGIVAGWVMVSCMKLLGLSVFQSVGIGVVAGFISVLCLRKVGLMRKRM